MNRIMLAMFCLAIGGTLSSGQDWIPKDAKVVYSSKQHDGFLPDGEVSLKIKTTPEQFEKIRQTLKLTLHTEDRKYSDNKVPWLSWGPKLDRSMNPVKGENEWNPTWDLSKTYVRQEGDTWEFMKYEDGYLFYCWINH